ncbi:MAG TPA: hypothetical protein VM753_05195 [Anaeromyxobacter sp.]|jgi:hypothetical protein|nr:hypothetical protein [Anaeromyxobacter sp.]
MRYRACNAPGQFGGPSGGTIAYADMYHAGFDTAGQYLAGLAQAPR